MQNNVIQIRPLDSIKNITPEEIQHRLMYIVDPNIHDKDGFSLLHAAASFWNIDAVQTLVSAGANTQVKTTSGFTPIHSAIAAGKVNIEPTAMIQTIKYLLDNGASATSTIPGSDTSLALYSTIKGYTKSSKILELHQSNKNHTPISLAIS